MYKTYEELQTDAVLISTTLFNMYNLKNKDLIEDVVKNSSDFFDTIKQLTLISSAWCYTEGEKQLFDIIHMNNLHYAGYEYVFAPSPNINLTLRHIFKFSDERNINRSFLFDFNFAKQGESNERKN